MTASLVALVHEIVAACREPDRAAMRRLQQTLRPPPRAWLEDAFGTELGANIAAALYDLEPVSARLFRAPLEALENARAVDIRVHDARAPMDGDMRAQALLPSSVRWYRVELVPPGQASGPSLFAFTEVDGWRYLPLGVLDVAEGPMTHARLEERLTTWFGRFDQDEHDHATRCWLFEQLVESVELAELPLPLSIVGMLVELLPIASLMAGAEGHARRLVERILVSQDAAAELRDEGCDEEGDERRLVLFRLLVALAQWRLGDAAAARALVRGIHGVRDAGLAAMIDGIQALLAVDAGEPVELEARLKPWLAGEWGAVERLIKGRSTLLRARASGDAAPLLEVADKLGRTPDAVRLDRDALELLRTAILVRAAQREPKPADDLFWPLINAYSASHSASTYCAFRLGAYVATDLGRQSNIELGLAQLTARLLGDDVRAGLAALLEPGPDHHSARVCMAVDVARRYLAAGDPLRERAEALLRGAVDAFLPEHMLGAPDFDPAEALASGVGGADADTMFRALGHWTDETSLRAGMADLERLAREDDGWAAVVPPGAIVAMLFGAEPLIARHATKLEAEFLSGAQVARIAPRLPRLATLVLDRCPLGAAGARAIASLDLPIEHLQLRFAGIGDDGAAALAASTGLSRVRWLMLGHNGIGDAGAVALASAQLGAVTQLRIEGNDIRDAGAMALAARGGLPRLSHLFLDDNLVTGVGARALAATDLKVSLEDCPIAD